MNNFPANSEFILAVFTSLLSFIVSFLLVKIQNANSKTISNITDEQKILQVEQSEIKELASSRLVSVKESEDAKDFLENDVPIIMSDIENRVLLLNNQKPIITFVVYLGLVIMLISLGSMAYLWYTIITNGWKVYISSLINVAIIIVFAFVYLGIESWIVRRFSKGLAMLKNRLTHVSSEIGMADELVRKSGK